MDSNTYTVECDTKEHFAYACHWQKIDLNSLCLTVVFIIFGESSSSTTTTTAVDVVACTYLVDI